MILSRRQAWVCAIATLSLLSLAVWSYGWMREQKVAAHHAMADLRACQRLAAEIVALRRVPTIASTETMGVKELGDRIEQASSRARLDLSTLEGTFPQTARRLGDSPYLQKPTQLAFRGVTLSQIAAFLYHIGQDASLTVSQLRLSTPRGKAAAHTWDAQATLTYLIYSPPKKARKSL